MEISERGRRDVKRRRMGEGGKGKRRRGEKAIETSEKGEAKEAEMEADSAVNSISILDHSSSGKHII